MASRRGDVGGHRLRPRGPRHRKRPHDMPSLQAAASVGQSALSTAYAEGVRRHGIVTSVVLLTRRDTADRTAYLHARDTFDRLLDLGVVPIVNENDTVSVEQIRFGDNDTLAALVACLVEADLMVILSDIEGLFDANPHFHPGAKLIGRVEAIGPEIMAVAGRGQHHRGLGRHDHEDQGGARAHGGRHPHGRVQRAARGRHRGRRGAGTWGPASSRRPKPHEITPKLWIALGDAARGALVVDEGAKAALDGREELASVGGRQRGGGRFEAGDIVDIKDREGHLFARGKAAFASDEAAACHGPHARRATAQPPARALADRPLVHRDELIVFE